MSLPSTVQQLQTDESKRLAALDSYAILDTTEEEVFDAFVRLAASVCGTPIALISFVDGRRQWFKARFGLKAKQTPREFAFCAHAIGSSEVFVVPDALQDDRFALNPLVTGQPKIRFYAGAPLITAAGEALGTLCVIDTIPREFTPAQTDALQLLSRHVMAQLALRRQLAVFARVDSARQKTVSDIRRAVECGEFVLHYQPTVDVRSGRVGGLEALIRWNCPERGLISPVGFLSVLEDSGLIIEVGKWVVRQVAADYQEWTDRRLTIDRIAVNVSSVQLLHPDFVEQLLRSLDPYGLRSVPLDIEIKESALAEDTDAIIGRLTELQRVGVGIALDDFGAGLSALPYLSRLPITSLKIHHGFIASMTRHRDDRTLVAAMISLAHNLDLSVVAEGVETKEQMEELRLLKCDRMQGYLFTHPVPKSGVEAILRNYYSDPESEVTPL